jgi:hypothetical protein
MPPATPSESSGSHRAGRQVPPPTRCSAAAVRQQPVKRLPDHPTVTQHVAPAAYDLGPWRSSCETDTGITGRRGRPMARSSTGRRRATSPGWRSGPARGTSHAEKPSTPPISIVWTQGEPSTDADCVLLTAALANGDAAIIEYGRWGVYNAILRVGRATRNARYFLADVHNVEPTDAA